MEQFAPSDELSEEQRKARRRTRVRLAILLVLLAVTGLDYLVSWPQSVRRQKELEGTLNALPLPSGTAQDSYDAGHKPRSGYASKVVVSSQTPEIVCEFFSTQLIARGWNPVQSDCVAVGHDPSRPLDKGLILKFSKGDTVCTITDYGYSAEHRRKYIITFTWGIPV